MKPNALVALRQGFADLSRTIGEMVTPTFRRMGRVMQEFSYEGRRSLYLAHDPGPWLRGDQ